MIRLCKKSVLVWGISLTLMLSMLAWIPAPVSAQTYPTITLNVHMIQEIDEIDLIGGDWDWYYYIGTYDGAWSWWGPHDAPNGQDVTIDVDHALQVTTSTFQFSVVFCEEDFWTEDDRADISSDLGGGADDVSSCVPDPDPPAGAYIGTWNLLTETLGGDTTTVDSGYFKTSGEFDGSTATDENDAAFWFDITDNYYPPTAEAGPGETGYVGDSISFNGSGSIGSPGSSIENYEWDFDDDGTYDSTGEITTTTFSTKGNHTVTLRVTDSIGTTATDTTWVDILNKDPVAAFTHSPLDPDTSDDIAFVDTSTDPDGTIASWSWDFGDGSTSTDNNPTHSYADDGEYIVTLNVTDNDGATNETSHPITILNVGPIASINVSPAEPIVDKEAQFTDTSTDSDGDIVSREWDFGDGQTSDVQNPTHQYDEVGEYNVTLTVTDDDGATDTFELTITVKEPEPPSGLGALADYWWLVVIIVIIVALVLILLLKRQKPAEETPPQEETPGETGPP